MRLFTPQTFSFVQRPLTLAAAVFVLSPIAIAQDLVLEEVTVTAKKTEVTLQDAAIAVSVTTGDDFDASNIMKLDNFSLLRNNQVVPRSKPALNSIF